MAQSVFSTTSAATWPNCQSQVAFSCVFTSFGLRLYRRPSPWPSYSSREGDAKSLPTQQMVHWRFWTCVINKQFDACSWWQLNHLNHWPGSGGADSPGHCSWNLASNAHAKRLDRKRGAIFEGTGAFNNAMQRFGTWVKAPTDDVACSCYLFCFVLFFFLYSASLFDVPTFISCSAMEQFGP